MNSAGLEEIYRVHHEKGSRYGYLYCHGERIPYLKKWIGRGKKVIDLGCRDGILTQGYADGNSILGVDIDKKALALCPQNLKTEWLDLNGEWPWPAESFDVVVACEIVEHIFFLPDFLQKASRVLKKGGLFIGSVPNGFRMRNRIKFLFGKEYETDPTHLRRFSMDQLTIALERHFSKIEIIPLGGKALPFLPVSPKMPKRLGGLFAKDLLWRSIKE